MSVGIGNSVIKMASITTELFVVIAELRYSFRLLKSLMFTFECVSSYALTLLVWINSVEFFFFSF